MLNRRLNDLQSGNTNAILLKQMLDELDPNEATEDALATLREIFSSCVKLRPTVTRLLEESYESDSYTQIQETFDCMNTAIELYTAIIIENKKPSSTKTETKFSNLLDISENTTKGNLSELNDLFLSDTASAQVDNFLQIQVSIRSN